MRRLAFAAALALTLTACTQPAANAPAPEPVTAAPVEAPARFVKLTDVASAHIEPRNVTIWLPPGYDRSGARYRVLYMHDGQNLFEPGYAYGGKEWQVDETLTRLIAEGKVPPIIVVGIWNTPTRWQDYAPQKVIERLPEPLKADMLADQGAPLKADAYLRFITEELKPQIDAAYRTRPDREHTLIAGSSMGGLISLYAAGEYPDVFGAAAGLSVHWPLADPTHPDALAAIDAMQGWLDASALSPQTQRLWFDHGDQNLDSYYAPYGTAMADWFAAKDWPASFNIYPGTDHNEAAWAARLEDPLLFLLAED